jgi:myosin heavy subunit
MSPLSVIVLLAGLIAFILGIYLAMQSSAERDAFKEERKKLEEEREALQKQAAQAPKKVEKVEPKKVEPKKAAEKVEKPEPKKSDEPSANEIDLKRQVDKLRGDNDELRKKQHDMTQDLKELRAREKEMRDRRPELQSAGGAVDLRIELGEVKAELEQWKQRALESESHSSRVEVVSTPTPEPEAHEPITGDEAGEQIASLRAEIERLKRALDTETNNLRRSADEAYSVSQKQLQHAQREHREADDELRKKLKATARDVDRQRRRADNNDKAYKITQRELDAARDRVRLLEEALQRASFAAASAAVVASQEAPAKEAQAEPASVAPVAVVAPIAALTPPAKPELEEVEPVESAGLGDEMSSVDDAWSELSLDEEI